MVTQSADPRVVWWEGRDFRMNTAWRWGNGAKSWCWETRGCPITQGKWFRHRGSRDDKSLSYCDSTVKFVSDKTGFLKDDFTNKCKSRDPLLRHNSFLLFSLPSFHFFTGPFYVFILYYFLLFLFKNALHYRISDSDNGENSAFFV
jgi:hypothetical protein